MKSTQKHLLVIKIWLVTKLIPNGAKIFLAKGTATFINGPANLLNKDPKNPPD